MAVESVDIFFEKKVANPNFLKNFKIVLLTR
jgi:hypothetical protein